MSTGKRTIEFTLNDENIQSYAGQKGYASLPSNTFTIPVDSAAVIQSGLVSGKETKHLLG